MEASSRDKDNSCLGGRQQAATAREEDSEEDSEKDSEEDSEEDIKADSEEDRRGRQ